MPRIFKGSESTLRLLIGKDCQIITNLKIKLYTTNIDEAIEVIDGFEVDGNIVTITLAPRAFLGMEDGLINYTIDGVINSDIYHTERQSNYFLKSLSFINEDGVAEQTKTITANGNYKITPNDGLYVDLIVDVADENGSYDEGYDDGYTQGALESKEVSYNAGYQQGQADVAITAIELDVTENGTYVSRFSDPILIKPEGGSTGILPDGTEFFSYATLNNVAFKTDILGAPDTYFELWWRDTNTANKDYAGIIGVAHNSDPNILFKLCKRSDGNYRIEYGTGPFDLDAYEFKYDMSSFTHIILSNKGLWLNDNLMYEFNYTQPFEENLEFYCQINDLEGDTYANGDYGVVIINNTTFIPSQNGFIEYNTKADVERIGDGDYLFAERNAISIEPEGELIKTVNVNVTPKINLAKEGIKFSYSTFSSLPAWADFSDVTDMSFMFQECKNIITFPYLDTSKVTNMSSMFSNCRNLKSFEALLDTSNVTNFENWLYFCQAITTIPAINTSKATDMGFIFNYCKSLVSVPALDARSLNMATYKGFIGYEDLPNLTDFGGLINLKCSLTSDHNFKRLPNLSYQSCINVLNGLFDFVGNGEAPNSGQGQLKVHQNFLDLVGDEISIGLNKGWIITA